MPHIREAILDAVEAAADLVDGFATRVAETLEDEIRAVCIVAARKGATRDDVRAAVERVRLRRASILAALDVARDADRLGARIAKRLKQAAAQGRGKRGPPIRKREVEERRRARGDSALVRLDRIEELPEPAVPALEDLAGRSDAELLGLLRSRGVDFDPDQELATQIERVAGRLIGAEHPDTALVERVIANAMSRARGTLLYLAKGAVREARQGHQRRGRAPSDLYLWVAVLDEKTCESCEDRHNESATMRDWEYAGTPGSPNLLCGGACRCELLPDVLFDPDTMVGGVNVTIEAEHVRE